MSTNGSRWEQIQLNSNRRRRKTPANGFPGDLMYLSRWEKWSQIIAARYTSVSARRGPLVLLFARQRSSQAFLSRVFHLGPFLLNAHIHFEPLTSTSPVYQTISSQVNWWQGLAGARDKFRGPTEREGTTASALNWATEYVRRRSQTVAETGLLVNRIFRRSEQLQATVLSNGVRTAVQPAVTVFDVAARPRVGDKTADSGIAHWPLPMILRRSARAEVSSSAHSGPRQDSYNQPAPLADPIAWPHPSASSVVDVSRLTDQVLQTIDRRLTSWRERMGRI